MSVYTKLMQARIELQNTKLTKSGHNKFAGYQYFELGDFLPTVQTIFSKLGLCGVITFGQELATLTIVDSEAPDIKIEITSPMAEANLKGCHPIQNLGAVETYTRRYLWVTALEIVEHDILDATTGSEKPSNVTKSIARSAWDELSVDEQTFLTNIAVEVIDAYTKNDLKTACSLFYDSKLDNEERIALWSRFDSKQRTAMKSYHDNANKPQPHIQG